MLLPALLDCLKNAEDAVRRDAENWDEPLLHAATLVDALAALLDVRLGEKQ